MATSSTSRSTLAEARIIKTFPGVEGPPIWMDIVRVAPGHYNVQLAHSGQVLAEGFVRDYHAEEWIVGLQAKQRGWVRA